MSSHSAQEPGHAYGALQIAVGDHTTITLLPEPVGGGSVNADVVEHRDGASDFVRKTIGPAEYEAFSARIGRAMTGALFDWIAGSWGSQPEKKDGTVFRIDDALTVDIESRFLGALVTGTTIPELDSTSTEPGALAISIQAEHIATSVTARPLAIAASNQRPWRATTFKVEIDGLDCTKVFRIDPFTVKRNVISHSSMPGDVRLSAGSVTFPNLRLTLASVTANSWLQWHKRAVVDGDHGEHLRRNGKISFLAADAQTELSRIELFGLGICRLQAAVERVDQSPAIGVELFCEVMRFVRPGVPQ